MTTRRKSLQHTMRTDDSDSECSVITERLAEVRLTQVRESENAWSCVTVTTTAVACCLLVTARANVPFSIPPPANPDTCQDLYEEVDRLLAQVDLRILAQAPPTSKRLACCDSPATMPTKAAPAGLAVAADAPLFLFEEPSQASETASAGRPCEISALFGRRHAQPSSPLQRSWAAARSPGGMSSAAAAAAATAAAHAAEVCDEASASAQGPAAGEEAAAALLATSLAALWADDEDRRERRRRTSSAGSLHRQGSGRSDDTGEGGGTPLSTGELQLLDMLLEQRPGPSLCAVAAAAPGPHFCRAKLRAKRHHLGCAASVAAQGGGAAVASAGGCGCGEDGRTAAGSDEEDEADGCGACGMNGAVGAGLEAAGGLHRRHNHLHHRARGCRSHTCRHHQPYPSSLSHHDHHYGCSHTPHHRHCASTEAAPQSLPAANSCWPWLVAAGGVFAGVQDEQHDADMI